MRTQTPSRTAEWVAAARTLGQLLPREERLAHDPYGIAFASGPLRTGAELLLAHPRVFALALRRIAAFQVFLWWMQLRTRVFDDLLREFVETGGRQVVLLGAGYDCRAVRFAALLHEVRLIEVDHPNTQAHKKRVLGGARLRSSAAYVAWDFERQPLSGLLSRLIEQGLAPEERVLTIWEGVTMYLSENAIADTFALVRRLGRAGSWLAFSYIDQRVLQAASGDQRITQRIAASVGEPHRFGWDPKQLPAWLRAHGYACVSDRSDFELAKQLLPGGAASYFASANRHIALASASDEVTSLAGA